MTSHQIHPEFPEPVIPPALAADVRAMHRGPVADMGLLDERVMAVARRHAAQRRARRIVIRVGLSLSAAACLALAVWTVWSPGGGGAGGAAMAFDPKKGVTILDAFRLAKLIEKPASVSKTWDVTNDGVVDKQDVDAIAGMAVKLKPGGES